MVLEGVGGEWGVSRPGHSWFSLKGQEGRSAASWKAVCSGVCESQKEGWGRQGQKGGGMLLGGAGDSAEGSSPAPSPPISEAIMSWDQDCRETKMKNLKNFAEGSGQCLMFSVIHSNFLKGAALCICDDIVSS